jgi:hypothetical protein
LQRAAVVKSNRAVAAPADQSRASNNTVAELLPHLPYIEGMLKRGSGDIVIGRKGPVLCAAVAADEDQQLAALSRRKGETLVQLLVRLEQAIVSAYDRDHFIDEINNGPDYSL